MKDNPNMKHHECRMNGGDLIDEFKPGTPKYKDKTITVLPDGSAFFVAGFPLPKDHWIYKKEDDSPAPFRCGIGEKVVLDLTREQFADHIRAATQYAIRASTMNGKDDVFDPDAMIQNMVVGMLGYHMDDGKSHIFTERGEEEK
jgi:hypothetical protein